MGTTSELTAKIEALKNIRPMPGAYKVEVMAGDAKLLVERISIDRELPYTKLPAPEASFMGVPIRQNDLLPPDMAAIFVNGELTQLIRFE